METIEFKYCLKDNDEVKEVILSKNKETGLNYREVCDMFADFMESIGFSMDDVYQYFE